MNNDNTNYSFMKSGRMVTEAQYEIEERELLTNITALVLLFIKNSLKTSSNYINHKNRSIITLDDISKSMKLETIIFFDRTNVNNEASQIADMIRNSDENEDIETAIEDIFQLATNEEVNNEYRSEKNCDCILCNQLDNIEQEWKNFNPISPFQIIIKNQINNLVTYMETR